MRGRRRVPPTQNNRMVLEDIARHMDLDPVSDVMMFRPESLPDELVRKLDARYESTLSMMESLIDDIKANVDTSKDPYAIGAKRGMLRFLAKHMEVVLKETDAMVLAWVEEEASPTGEEEASPTGEENEEGKE